MKFNISFTTSDEQETLSVGECLGKTILSKNEKGSVIGLIGNLGAGKTVFTKGIAKGLNVDEPNSPTFVIMRNYEGKIPLFHFDLYRLSGSGEFEEIGSEEFIYGSGISVIEWADKILDVLPKNAVIIEFSNLEESGEINSRKIKIKGSEQWLLSFKNTAEQVLQTLKK